ncbi:hypothetical protein Bpfe_028979, partial [Biomphalaria pfeifferi]
MLSRQSFKYNQRLKLLTTLQCFKTCTCVYWTGHVHFSVVSSGDLAKELNQTAPELIDNEDTTCLKDNLQSVSMQMLPGPFSFFRVVVNKAQA